MEKRKENLEELELVRMAQHGDSDAEEALIRKYKNVVKAKSYPYFIIGADREDIVQEGMIGLFKAIRGYRHGKEASFRTFAELCINRQIITAIKNAGRAKHSPLNTYISLSHPLSEGPSASTLEETLLSDSNSDPEAQLLLKEIMDFIGQNGSDIFSEMELKVWGQYLKGKSYIDISKDLGKSPKSVDNAIQRTKRKLEAYLSDGN